MTYEYEPDEVPKKKHHWGNDHAGLLEVGGEVVGKCPAKMSLTAAEDLLNDGLPWFPHRWLRSYPQRIYGIYGGVLYRATPTNPGTSYHGFPEHPALFPKGAQDLKRDILARAREQDCETEVRTWMNW